MLQHRKRKRVVYNIKVFEKTTVTEPDIQHSCVNASYAQLQAVLSHKNPIGEGTGATLEETSSEGGGGTESWGGGFAGGVSKRAFFASGSQSESGSSMSNLWEDAEIQQNRSFARVRCKRTNKLARYVDAYTLRPRPRDRTGVPRGAVN